MMNDSFSCSNRAASCALFSVAQAALGAGVGMMLSGRFSRSSRNVAVIAAISVGVATAVPLLVSVLQRKLNAPHTDRGMRRRLRSIREDSGFQSESEFF